MGVQEISVPKCLSATPLCQLHYFVCPICYKHVISMISTHIENLIAIPQQVTWVWKKGKTWQTSSQCSLWYWWYWNDIEPELRAEAELYFMCTAIEIPWPWDCQRCCQEGILPLVLQTFSSWCSDLSALRSNVVWTVTYIAISSEVPCVLQDLCVQNSLWQSWGESQYKVNHK